MRNLFLLALCVLVLGAYGCSTASVRMMPGEDVNHAVARDITREGAEEAAVKAANKYCTTKQKEAVFVTDKSQYTGSMDENTRNTIRKGSTAAMILGGAGTVPGQTRTAGAVLGSAGTVGYVMTSGKDYEATVDFKCR